MTSGEISSDRFSSTFYLKDGDLTIQSSDGVLFCVHSKNLSTLSGAFPPREALSTSGTDSPDETPVQMTENAAVLELFFQYFYPHRQPDLLTVPFETLSALAEAVEKYEVYPATRICSLCMSLQKEKHPLAVLCYAAKHGYTQLVNDTASLTIDCSFEEAFKKLPIDVFAHWARYVAFWQRNILFFQNFQEDAYLSNSNSPSAKYQEAIRALKRVLVHQTPSSLKSARTTVYNIRATKTLTYNGRMTEDTSCTTALIAVENNILEKIDAIPKLHDLISGKV